MVHLATMLLLPAVAHAAPPTEVVLDDVTEFDGVPVEPGIVGLWPEDDSLAYGVIARDTSLRGVPLRAGDVLVRDRAGDLRVALDPADPVLCDVRYAPVDPDIMGLDPVLADVLDPADVVVHVEPPGHGRPAWTVTGVLADSAEVGGLMLGADALTSLVRVAGDCRTGAGTLVTRGLLDAPADVGGRSFPAGASFWFSGSALYVQCSEDSLGHDVMWVPGMGWYDRRDCASEARLGESRTAPPPDPGRRPPPSYGAADPGISGLRPAGH